MDDKEILTEINRDWNGEVGTYTMEEFKAMVDEYRERWCRNMLSAPVGYDSIKFFGDKRVVYSGDTVKLEAIDVQGNSG